MTSRIFQSSVGHTSVTTHPSAAQIDRVLEGCRKAGVPATRAQVGSFPQGTPIFVAPTMDHQTKLSGIGALSPGEPLPDDAMVLGVAEAAHVIPDGGPADSGATTTTIIGGVAPVAVGPGSYPIGALLVVDAPGVGATPQRGARAWTPTVRTATLEEMCDPSAMFRSLGNAYFANPAVVRNDAAFRGFAGFLGEMMLVGDDPAMQRAWGANETGAARLAGNGPAARVDVTSLERFTAGFLRGDPTDLPNTRRGARLRAGRNFLAATFGAALKSKRNKSLGRVVGPRRASSDKPSDGLISIVQT